MSAKAQTKTDAGVREAVLLQLEWEPEIASKHIGVTVKDGVVTLTGIVDTCPERLAAERAADRAYGIKAVANDIKARLPYMRADADLANDVEQALLANVSVPEDTVKVTVKDGWVTLEGTVDWRFQKEAAEETVRFVAGVRGISDRIKIESEL